MIRNRILITGVPLLALLALASPSHAATVTVPGSIALVPLDVATVTTGGVAVTALIAGHRTGGGFLLNPVGAIAPLCINEQGTAVGTTSAGSVICIAAGASFNLAPSPMPVSVVSSDSAHGFAGEGYTQ